MYVCIYMWTCIMYGTTHRYLCSWLTSINHDDKICTLFYFYIYIIHMYSVNTHRPSIIFLLYTQYYLYPDTCGYPCTCTDCFWVTATFFHFLDFLVFGFLIVYVNHECMSCMCTYSTYIWSFTYIHVYIHKHIYVHLYVPVCMYVYMYIHIHTYIHVYR